MRVILFPLLFAVAPIGLSRHVATARPVDPRPAADSLAEKLQKEVGPWLETQAKNGAFSGVVLVTRNGAPLFSATYGMADRARKVPNTLDTRFNLGSMNKMWTAIAIAQLVEQGKVDLDATVGTYVPDLPNQAIRETVKVRHLLSHTSGMGTYLRNGFLRTKFYAAKAADFVPYYANDSLAFTPGARMQYSNSGFALLGLIVERVSGQSFYDYAKKNIIERADMTRAEYADVRQHPTDVAVGYAKLPQDGSVVENWDLIEQHSSPAGGAYASARDLVAFSRALWSGKLVGLPLVKEFTTGKVAMGPQMQYAFGFGTGDIQGWRQVGHNGGIAGANAEFMMFPDKGVDVVVLANIDAPAATAVVGQILSALTGVKLQFATDGPPPGASNGPAIPAGMADRLPDTEQGRRVAAFIEAYSKGSGPALAEFIEKQAVPRTDRTVEERAKGLNGLYDRTGKLTFKRLLEVRDDAIRMAILTERDGEIQLTVAFEPAPPHRVASFNFEAPPR
jgi:CubicO group peptidase (beta-lactamase class C family)